MDNKTNLPRIKTTIAVVAAAVLLCIAAAVGYALFSPDNAADTAESATTVIGSSESYVTATQSSGANSHSNNAAQNTTQKSNTQINGTAISVVYSHSKTVGNTAQKQPTSVTAKPQSTGNNTTISQSRCEIEIICKTAVEYAKNHPSVALSDKAMSGVILQSTAVEILSGDTAFDVLKRVCTENNISLEFTKTPLYNSYYIEGIGGLYEFDCGSSSGWIYSVNGERPSRSCSEYRLNDGDKIVFAYTLKNGADI